MKKFKNGDKVKILSKSIGCPLEQSFLRGTGTVLCYLRNFRSPSIDRNLIMVQGSKGILESDYFLERDLEKIEVEEDFFFTEREFEV